MENDQKIIFKQLFKQMYGFFKKVSRNNSAVGVLHKEIYYKYNLANFRKVLQNSALKSYFKFTCDFTSLLKLQHLNSIIKNV